jgi:hypothetical protein
MGQGLLRELLALPAVWVRTSGFRLLPAGEVGGRLCGVVAAFGLPVLAAALTRTISVILWGGVIGGTALHEVVSRAKQGRADGGRPPLIALRMTLVWADALSGYIVWKLLVSLVGLMGLVLALPD